MADDAPVRFFARLRAAVLECPGCGRLYELRPAPREHHRQDALVSRRYWDALSGRFACPGCGKAYQLGIVAYELAQRASATIPADWRPTPAQALWMRDRARGWLNTDPPKRPEPAPDYANVLVGHAWPDAAELGVELPPEPERPWRPTKRIMTPGLEQLLYGGRGPEQEQGADDGSDDDK